MTNSASPEVIPAPSIHEVPRPVIQRRELGPIVHSWGTLILEEMATMNLADSERYTRLSFTTDFDQIIDASREAARKAVWRVVDERSEAENELTDELYSAGGTGALTHALQATQLLHEGIASGILIPANLFAIVHRRANREATVERYTEALRNPDFRDCMVRAGHAANGFWGSLSSGRYINFMGHHKSHLDEEALRGGIYALSPTTIAGMRAGLQKVNNLKDPEFLRRRQSGGCPVRHQDFPERTIGDFARDYLTRHDMPMPPAEGPSLIEDVMTVQADLIDQLLEA